MSKPHILKPCPFCGGSDLDHDREQGRFHVGCRSCGGVSLGHATAKLAVEAWNRREPAQPGPKKVVCPNCTTEVVTVMIRKEDRGLGSVPNHYHYCQECKVRLEK